MRHIVNGIVMALVIAHFFVITVKGFAQQQTGIVTGDPSVNIRDTPTTMGKIIGSVLKGQTVVILERTNNEELITGKTGKWLKIENNGKTGWAFGGFISIDGASVAKEDMTPAKNNTGDVMSISDIEKLQTGNTTVINGEFHYDTVVKISGRVSRLDDAGYLHLDNKVMVFYNGKPDVALPYELSIGDIVKLDCFPEERQRGVLRCIFLNWDKDWSQGRLAEVENKKLEAEKEKLEQKRLATEFTRKYKEERALAEAGNKKLEAEKEKLEQKRLATEFTRKYKEEERARKEDEQRKNDERKKNEAKQKTSPNREGELSTKQKICGGLIGIGALIFWHLFLRRRCPKCRSLEYTELKREVIDRFSERRGRSQNVSKGGREYTRKFEWDVRITVYMVKLRCNQCKNEWEEKEKSEEKGSEHEI